MIRASRHRIVAVIGAGVIGRSWMRVFARAGLETRVWDPDPVQVDQAWDWYKTDQRRLRKQGGMRKGVARNERSNVARCRDLAEALQGATWVQECGPEDLDVKRGIFADLDRHADPVAILASSTASLDMTLIAEGLAGEPRCLVAHPVNPPHVIPLVEVLGGRNTDPLAVRRAIRFLERVGQAPVLLRRYVPGFLLNRLQAAVLREALFLVSSGVARADAIETVVKDGLGLRWAFLGPLDVPNTNADGGIREYFARRGVVLSRLWDDLGKGNPLTPELVERLGQDMDLLHRKVPRETLREWRDDMITRLRRLKAAHPPGGVPEPEEE
ncbi:MAG TPA: 3-hydroxyacyl-CoA dehydrogenase NAD-binding domain-containing protein [Gemmatimonadales bacterium]|nr:3-hydroxyacyl-CoA dehydrogenase NAD-binding domain-containing protein [Gemmatimonadales bacterium]